MRNTKTIILPLLFLLLLSACAGTQKTVNGAHVPNNEQGEVHTVEELYKQQRARMDKLGRKLLVVNVDLCKQVLEQPGFDQCDYRFIIEPHSGEEQAFSDGKNIYMTPQLIDALESDDRLSWIMARHMAHNMMQHPQKSIHQSKAARLKGLLVDLMMFNSGVDTKGGFTKEMAEASEIVYSDEFTKESDYLGLYLLIRAGFDGRAALDHWHYRKDKKDAGISEYEGSELRLRALEDTFVEISLKQENGALLIPQISARRAFRSDLKLPQ